MIKNIIENWKLAKKNESRMLDVILDFFVFTWIDIKRPSMRIFRWMFFKREIIFAIMNVILMVVCLYNLYCTNKYLSSANQKLQIISDSVSTNRIIEPKYGDRVE